MTHFFDETPNILYAVKRNKKLMLWILLRLKTLYVLYTKGTLLDEYKTSDS